MKRLSPARRRVLALLADGPLDDFGRVVQRIQRKTLEALQDDGLVRFQPYAKPWPTWRITKAGRASPIGAKPRMPLREEG